MVDNDRARLVLAIVATVGFMTGLGLYLAHRDRLADGIVEAAIEHGENNSMISKAHSDRPPEARFEVFWRCKDGPEMARVIYAASEAAAVSDAGRMSGARGCKVSHAKATTKPLCNAERDCSVAYEVR